MGQFFTLAEPTFQRGTDYDVVMLYQVLLGRNPESSHVIMEHRANTLAGAFRTFITSDEFLQNVVGPIRQGQPVRRPDGEPRPNSDQLAWLFDQVLFDEADREALRAAPDWDSVFGYLIGLEGFLDPRPQLPAETAPAAPPVLAGPPLRARVVENPLPPPHAIPPALGTVLARLDRIEAMIGDLTLRLDALQPGGGAAASSRPAKDSAKRVRQAR